MYQMNIGFHKQVIIVNTDSQFIHEYLIKRFARLILNETRDFPLYQTITFSLAGIDPAHLAKDPAAWQKIRQLEYDIMEAMVNANGQYLWFHAGAVECEGRAVLLTGKTGCGKSTMSLGLCRPGGPWRFMGDDSIPFEIETQVAYPFLRSPWFRQGNGRKMDPDRLWELPKKDVELDEKLIGQGPARLSLIIFPVYMHGGSLHHERMEPMSVAWELTQQAFNFPVHGARALQFCADVARTVPAFRIEYSDSREAIDRIEELWAAECASNAAREVVS